MPRKRKKRRGYHRGVYASPVAGECKYRSSWEEKYMRYLDSTPEISMWSYEKIVIEYVSNIKTGKLRKYYPDFFLELQTGEKILVEIKQKRKLQTSIVKKKALAAEQWCKDHGATYEIITEIELKELGII